MSESLIALYCVEEEGLIDCKLLSSNQIMIFGFEKEVPANFVPAAAVIRKVQALNI